jgi:hypothetical protein
MPHIATNTTAPAPILRVKPVDGLESPGFFEGAAVFELGAVFERSDFFTGIDIPLREIYGTPWVEQSEYRGETGGTS